MRIQSINQSNYQNKNIGFESARVKVNIPSINKWGGMHDDIITLACIKAFERVRATIKEFGGKLVQRINDTELEVFIIDKQTDPALGHTIDLLNKIEGDRVAYPLSENLVDGLNQLVDETQPVEMVLTVDDIELGLHEWYSSGAKPEKYYEIKAEECDV